MEKLVIPRPALPQPSQCKLVPPMSLPKPPGANLLCKFASPQPNRCKLVPPICPPRKKKMKNLEHYILALLTALVFVGCADETNDLPEQDVEFCVRAAWQDGLSGGTRTRALTATDLLADGTDDKNFINIHFDDYPAKIDVVCKKGDDVIKEFTLTKGGAECTTHNGCWHYTPSFFFRDQLIRREHYTFHATAVIDEDGDPSTTDDGDRLEGTATKADIDGKHLKLTLHHTKALLRFAFKVDQRYDKVRKILVTGIKLNDKVYTVAPKVLNTTTPQAITYCYLNPDEVGLTTKTNTIECTYSIYDNDADFNNLATDYDATISANATHLTRQDIKARNSFTLGKLVSNGSPVEQITAGYYYDLRATLNPDYLYVLSEHDNQHLKIE